MADDTAPSSQQSARRYEQLWQAALGDLQGQVSRANYETWLRSTSLVSVAGETATVAAPNAFAVDQLRHKFDREITGAISSLVNRPVTVEYVVRGSSGEPAPRVPKPKPRPEPPASRVTRDASPTPQPQAQQMTLAPAERPGLNPGYTFESFVVGPSNRLPHAAAMAVGDKPGQAFNPLFIYGGVGLGKTHLLHAIGHRAIDQRPETQVLYVSSEKSPTT
jgi:chromosomal replication initiator protein